MRANVVFIRGIFAGIAFCISCMLQGCKHTMTYEECMHASCVSACMTANDTCFAYNKTTMRRKKKFKLRNCEYINLDRRPDREQHMNDVLTNASLTCNRFSAFDTKDPQNRNGTGIRNLTDCYKPFKACAGAWGCQMSHYLLLDQAISQNLSHVLILEDDFQFSDAWMSTAMKHNKTLSSLIEDAVNKLPSNWDVLGLAHSFMTSIPFCNRTFVAEQFELVRLMKAQSSAAYLVNRRVMKDLRDAISPDQCPGRKKEDIAIDTCWWPIMRERLWFGFAVGQQPGTQMDSFSDVSGQLMKNNETIGR